MSSRKKICLTLAAVALVGCSSSGGSTDSPVSAANTAGGSSAGGVAAGGGSGTLGVGGYSPSGGASASAGGLGGSVAGGAGTSGGGAGNATGGSSASAGGSSSSSGGNSAAGSAGTASMAGAGGGSTGAQPFKGVANSPCAARTALNVSWYYNWTQKETEPCTGGKGGLFVPMIWGHAGDEQNAATITTAIAGFVSKGYKFVLGFNEPDNMGQANILAPRALELLPAFNNAAIAVGTPATSANAAGQTWFKTYMADVAADTTLRADFVAIHWYGWNAGSCDAKASQLESYIKYAEGFPGNKPIWITEWGCLNLSAPTTASVVDFYKGALAVFSKHPRLVRYAWYPWSTNLALNNPDGSLTDLGVAYAAAPATK